MAANDPSPGEAQDPRCRLDALEAQARALQCDATWRAEALRGIAGHAEAFITALEGRAVYVPDEGGTPGALALDEHGAGLDEALALLADEVEAPGLNISSSRFFGFIPSGGLYPAALADYLLAVTNRYAGVQFAAPGAVRLERTVLQWLARELGYPAEAEGDLTSGGSIANLSAIVAAREAFEIRSRDVERRVVYFGDLTHHSVTKALRIAGLGDCPVRRVPLDAAHRLDAGALEAQVRADRAGGLSPWLVIASAGTTDTGSVDPLAAIADITARHGLWYHVDAAYGGAFALCEAGRARLAGLERSDSLIFDPHKGLFLPFGTGVVLVRDGRALRGAFRARGAYMQDLDESPMGEHSPCDLSPELTRPLRGLRLWLPLKLLGVAPFRAALEEKLLLTEYFHERMREVPGFELGPPPDLSIVTFRYLPARGDPDAFNRRLAEAIRDDGRIFLSTTTLEGRFVLRFAVLGYHTHRSEVDLAIEVIREQAEALARA